MITEKQCTMCGEVKPLEEFYRDSRAKDGHRSNCKSCRIAQVGRYQKAHRKERTEYQRRWHAENPGENALYVRRYKEKHPDKVIAYIKEWAQAHPDKVNAANARYRQAHPDRATANSHRYRAKQAGVKIEPIDVTKIHEYWGLTCAYCGSTENLTLDHIVPLSQDGPHTFDNICIACQSCNSSKNNKKLINWILWKTQKQQEMNI